MFNLYNYEKLVVIIIIIIIIFLCLKKKGLLERFENDGNVIDTLLNSYDTTDKKFNNMVDNIDSKTVTFGKNIVSKGNIVTQGDLKVGENSTITKAGNMYLKGHIKSVNNDKGAALNSTDIKKMKSLKSIAGYAIDGQKSTHLLFEGGWHSLHSGTYDAWSKDSWDRVYLFKGWKGQFAEDTGGKGKIDTFENKNENVKKFTPNGGNKTSSYKITWVDY